MRKNVICTITAGLYTAVLPDQLGFKDRPFIVISILEGVISVDDKEVAVGLGGKEITLRVKNGPKSFIEEYVVSEADCREAHTTLENLKGRF